MKTKNHYLTKIIIFGLVIVVASHTCAFAVHQEITCPTGTPEGSHCWQCGENCYATLTGTTMNISGSGVLDSLTTRAIQSDDYIAEGARYASTALWMKYPIETVNIGKDITQIGKSAFDGMPIKHLNFEEGSQLKIIWDRAFTWTAVNGNVVLPPSINPAARTDIHSFAFEHAANLICTEAQVNGVCGYYSRDSFGGPYFSGTLKQYEKQDDKYIITYDGQTEIYSLDFTKRYDEKGNIIATYDGDNNLLSMYLYGADGSIAIYDANGKLVGLKGKRILSVDEAVALVKNNKNTFTLRYR